jgi:leucyl/phenylalanyl-tRNA--protein transferase
MDALSPDMLLVAYANGYFPMAMEKDDPELYWFSPEQRGVLPLDKFHVPRGLKRVLKENPFTMKVDTAFEQVIRACGTITEGRHETWINENIVALYTELFRMGHAHSVESWLDGELVGGLYGVSLGGAFFGESMFSRRPEASKVALVTLVEILREAEYMLLDTQYVNPHLTQFGVEAISKKSYKTKLEKALNASPNPSTRFSTVSVRRGLASSSSASVT